MARVLVVDDSELDRLFERTLLEKDGHELFFARDGEQALNFYTDHRIELVVTDLHMPNVNGFRLIQELRALDPEALIIAVSGVSADQLELAREFGAAFGLFKPIEPAVFLETVRKALGGDLGGDAHGEGHDP